MVRVLHVGLGLGLGLRLGTVDYPLFQEVGCPIASFPGPRHFRLHERCHRAWDLKSRARGQE